MAHNPGPSLPAKLKKIMLPMIKKVVPGTIMKDIVGVQPMSATGGTVFNMRYNFDPLMALKPFTGEILFKVTPSDQATNKREDILMIQQHMLDYPEVLDTKLMTNRAGDAFIQLTLENAVLAHKFRDMVTGGPCTYIYAVSHDVRPDDCWYMNKAYCSAVQRFKLTEISADHVKAEPTDLYKLVIYKGSALTEEQMDNLDFESVRATLRTAAGF